MLAFFDDILFNGVVSISFDFLISELATLQHDYILLVSQSNPSELATHRCPLISILQRQACYILVTALFDHEFLKTLFWLLSSMIIVKYEIEFCVGI